MRTLAAPGLATEVVEERPVAPAAGAVLVVVAAAEAAAGGTAEMSNRTTPTARTLEAARAVQVDGEAAQEPEAMEEAKVVTAVVGPGEVVVGTAAVLAKHSIQTTRVHHRRAEASTAAVRRAAVTMVETRVEASAAPVEAAQAVVQVAAAFPEATDRIAPTRAYHRRAEDSTAAGRQVADQAAAARAEHAAVPAEAV